ncbi:hypothetical protein [Pseudomonas sp. W5-36]|uniref:hypothetical protein n=1 Tax=Pseudomonas sp. W5-36 TaxID=3097455 RepID=UPI0039797E5F
MDDKYETQRRAAIAKRKKTEQDYRGRAAENMVDHEYTSIVDQRDAVIWRCKAAKSTFYAFDILMTRFGIAVVGDIDNLTFSVGLSYGIEFLAGDDVSYYLHTKLSEVCKKRSFSEDLFREVLMRNIAQALHEECEEEMFESLPEWLQDSDRVDAIHWHEFRQLVLAKRRVMSHTDDRWMHWDDALDAAHEITSTDEAMMFMRDNSEALCLGDEWYETRVDEPSQGLMQCLYMINHAAKAIMAQKGQAAA